MNDTGARILLVDDEEAILKLLRFPLEKEGYQVVTARDGEEALEVFSGERFDLVILDPPKFAASAGQVASASRGYKDINLLAFKLLRPGGMLFTFSCSGHISPALFQKIVSDAALDARRDARIIRYLGQASDHPVALTFPEGQYLKGLVCTVS